jgi:hypothetical protein
MGRRKSRGAKLAQRNIRQKAEIGRSLGYARRGGGKRARINRNIMRTHSANRVMKKERNRDEKRGLLPAGWQAAKKIQLAIIKINLG